MTDPKIVAVQAYLNVPGQSPLAGQATGKSAALDYFGRIMGLTAGTYAITGIIDWLVSEDRVALIACETAARDGVRIDWTRIVVFRFVGELVTEIALYDDDLYELDKLLNV